MNPEQKYSGRLGDWVLYNCNQFIAWNKPAGLPVQRDRTGDKSMLELAAAYCQRNLYPVHRLDRPASGVLVFAKTSTAARSLSEQFREHRIEKTYLAVVKNLPPDTQGVLRHFLKRDGRTNRSVPIAEGEQNPEGKRAALQYELLGSIRDYHLLAVWPLTGRHHQIRVQLAAAGCPIRGDAKYGFRRPNADRSIHLHAWKLRFAHPVSGEPLQVEAPIPADTLWQAFVDAGVLGAPASPQNQP